MIEIIKHKDYQYLDQVVYSDMLSFHFQVGTRGIWSMVSFQENEKIDVHWIYQTTATDEEKVFIAK